MATNEAVLVSGAGGFIGGALVSRLLSEGNRVRAVDIKPAAEWFQLHEEAENVTLDLRESGDVRQSVDGVRQIYNLACDMGGMGFIENNKALCMLSVLINTQLLYEGQRNDVDRYFYSSSACVYAADRQVTPDVLPLRESDAYPADPEDGYGWEKLFGERTCRHFSEDFSLVTRIGRYHNVYGPNGTYSGGREKAPAAICRKVAEAKLSGRHVIDIWGDGGQTRSFTYIDDCIEGTRRLMDSDLADPVNIGSSEMVSINGLVDLVEGIAGVRLERNYISDAPQGVRGRNSDNTLILQELGWEPSVTLRTGLEKTYRWIYDEIASDRRRSA